MTTYAKIIQVSHDGFYIFKTDKYHSPSIYIDDFCVHQGTVGKYVKSCKSFEEARMIIDLNGWEYVDVVDEYPPIVISKKEYKKKYRRDFEIGYSEIDQILVDNGYEKYYT